MKDIPRMITSLMSIVLVLFVPLHALAQDGMVVAPPVYPSPIIITELQTGGATASDEFIELYNTSPTDVDITGWQVRYNNAASSSRDTTLLAALEPASGDRLILAAASYLVLHTPTILLPEPAQGLTYSAKLSSADKVVALYKPNLDTCELVVQDAVAWGASTDGEGQAAVSQTSADRLLSRYRNSDGYYIDTNHNNYDFMAASVVKTSVLGGVAAGATPAADNMLTTSVTPTPATAEGSTLVPIAIDGCIIPDGDPPDDGTLGQADESPPAIIEDPSAEADSSTSPPVLPLSDIGLNAPQISELLPNPASPLTDAEDEFVELYNPNDAPFDLSGFVLEASKRHYAFTAGTTLAPKEFKAFFSAQTHLALPNTTGQVLLLDPLGNTIGQSGVYGAAKDNYAWVLAAGTWQWTVRPTPNAANVVAAPATKTAGKAATATKPAVKGASTTAAKTTKTAAKKTTTTPTTIANDVARNPLHPGVLALVGSFALLYGAYEYRSDVANRIHQFRVYRAARRENRQGAQGRGSDRTSE